MNCYHCQQPVPAGIHITDDHGHAYCCHACEAVAHIISAHHLEQYYQVRDRPAPRPEHPYDPAHWQAYDLPEIAAQYTYKDGDDQEIHLYIDGLHCAACTWLISHALQDAHGISHTRINLGTGRAEIRWRDTPLSAILATIASLGYTPNLHTPDEEDNKQRRERNHDLLRLIVAGLGMMQVMMFATGLYTGAWHGIDHEYEQLLRWISLLCSAPVMLYAGYPYLKNAWLGLRHRQPNMDLPIALACAGAWLASLYHTLIGRGEIYYDGVTMFIFFISISRYLEAHTRRRARHNQQHFARLLPDAVYKYNDRGEAQLVPLPTIQPGDHIRVLPTHTIPVDGEITGGASRIDENMLTGESTPQYKTSGDRVHAGSTNLQSPLDIRVTQTGQQTTLAAIRRISARAEQHRSPQIDRNQALAQQTVLAVLILAAAGYLLWQWIEPARAFDIALAILVATCPCALSLATPTVLTAALNHAHKHHILIKNSNTLDRLTHIRRILFDKTGTLTQGKYQLRRSDYYGEPRRLLAIAKTLETHSTHPIAWYYSQQPVANVAMDNIEQHSGKGISGDYDGSRWHIGSAAYMQENGVEIPPADLPPPPVGEGRGGVYPHTTATETSAEQPPPPVGEGRGGAYPHTAATEIPAEQPPPPVGEGWDGAYPHTTDADTTTDADWSLMADKNNVGHKYPTYEENNPLPCEAGGGWGGGVEKSRMATTDNKAVPCYPKLTPPRPSPTGGGSALTDANTTHVYLAENRELRAHYQLGDPERDNLAATLARLQAHYHLAIASGDRAENVARLAARYGITDWHGGLDPAAKLALLEANDPEHTLMIGDGINDAPVLARASVSVAVGRANPLSQTHADIVLLKNGPEALPYLLDLAARSRRITRQNLIWATVYNLTILPLAISGYLTPWIAALGMSTSSLLVIANALRIHRTLPPPATK
ncbi:Type cbb3 cytochrome oxidase biogenesis protein CcoI; Copper-translocating P-type ATPase [Cardiobacterium hominis]|uniref:Type cbb3 cytochrome oxidase biogenesis protein CcoI Copper-translocating P-type ATPase n=2 Tax=Cardiobacterium hominis TaxID=2718 RepID=A0A1C3H6D9_9GAMM|nr:heavy metal translocating P-type ATPase [Cardiobacterium hominis]SAM70204.1 Type cbb3 cytochrome oxidase biogenesis protein CcoI; Copper-translocating P-type ATPase [Cardiobacterium hominis]